jgi:hypothetical protein
MNKSPQEKENNIADTMEKFSLKVSAIIRDFELHPPLL